MKPRVAGAADPRLAGLPPPQPLPAYGRRWVEGGGVRMWVSFGHLLWAATLGRGGGAAAMSAHLL